MPKVDVTEPALLIRIPHLFYDGMPPDALYEATRGVWRLGERRHSVRFALAVADGVVREVFTVNAWQPAGTAAYSTRSINDYPLDGRWEFTGDVAPESLRDKYIGKSVAHYLKRGNANPCMYVNV
jgi:hypothetical protein